MRCGVIVEAVVHAGVDPRLEGDAVFFECLPRTMGVLLPTPGTSVFHWMFSVSLHVVGVLEPTAASEASGPCHCGHWMSTTIHTDLPIVCVLRARCPVPVGVAAMLLYHLPADSMDLDPLPRCCLRGSYDQLSDFVF